MIRLIRIVGFLLIAAGAVITLTWLIEPLRAIWPWLARLPVAIQIALGIAAVGFLLLLGSILWERWEDRDRDRGLLDDLDHH